MRFRAIIEVEYDVNPEHYRDSNGELQSVEAMLAIDLHSLEDDPESFVGLGTDSDTGTLKTKLEEAK